MSPLVKHVKRAMDVTGSVAGLALFGPLFPLAAALIKLEDGGPVFYRQVRAGGCFHADGEATRAATFEMIKFRTMREDAEGDGRPQRAAKNDRRTTRIGRILRKTRLDELPQLLNVLRGEMSLVGPRPERPVLVEELAAAVPFYEERTRLLKPGITGLAQVSLDYMGHMDDRHALATLRPHLVNPYGLAYDGTADADDVRTKILFDFAYAASLERFSTFLATDLLVIIKTPLVMLLGKGR